MEVLSAIIVKVLVAITPHTNGKLCCWPKESVACINLMIQRKILQSGLCRYVVVVVVGWYANSGLKQIPKHV